MISDPIITIDVHGMTVEKALETIHKKVDSAGTAVYEIRVIHGFHGGIRIRSAIKEEFSYGRSTVQTRSVSSNDGANCRRPQGGGISNEHRQHRPNAQRFFQ